MEETADSDYVYVVDRGCIAAEGRPSELQNKYSLYKLKLNPVQGHEQQLMSQLQQFGLSPYTDRGQTVVELADSHEAFRLLNKLQPGLAEFEGVKGCMDDIYLRITGHEIRNGGAAQCE